MGNLNFALFTAAYLYLVGWIFVQSRSFESLIVFGLALSPLVALGLALQGRAVRQIDHEKTSPNAWLAHGLALVASIGLIIFVNSVMSREGSMLFFMDYLKGWTLDDAIAVLLISAAMGASALTVWTSYRFRMTKSAFMRDRASYMFFAGAPEHVRLLLYMYMVAFAWALGVAAVSLIWDKPEMPQLILRMARACLPLTLMLIVAMFRLPFLGLGFLVSLGGVWYLAAVNTNELKASVFVGVPLAAMLLYFGVKTILSAGSRKPAAAEPASESADTPEKNEAPDKDSSDT